MKKVGIITINDNDNYGNRLQNYAVQEILVKNKFETYTILNNVFWNNKEKSFEKKLLKLLKYFKGKIKRDFNNLINRERHKLFLNFNKNIIYNKKTINSQYNTINNKYDYFIVGSDQVWNPNFRRLSDVDLLSFADSEKRISFSASFGISELPNKFKEKTKKELLKFKAISVREDAGKNIVEDLTGRKDVEVLVDPTMLLTSKEWDKVSKKPKMLHSQKYILNYFLGELSQSRKEEINRVAKENDCEVIDILDKNSPFYQTGPSEFLYLEKNAFLICTDSFHSCVFAILYNRPFVVFEREDNTVSMNSRIETLINKFQLENRIFKNSIIEENIKHDYTNAYKILEQERNKSMKFLKKALESKE